MHRHVLEIAPTYNQNKVDDGEAKVIFSQKIMENREGICDIEYVFSLIVAQIHNFALFVQNYNYVYSNFKIKFVW
jgi:hypothetical protein